MRQFYETYRMNKKVSPAVRQLHPSAQNLFKDSYVADFLNLPNGHAEPDLHDGLVRTSKHVSSSSVVTLAVGSEYPLQAGIGSSPHKRQLIYRCERGILRR